MTNPIRDLLEDWSQTQRTPMITTKAQVRDEMRGQLYEPQRALLNRIKASFANNEPVAICAGQRSGKTFMESVLSFDYQHVIVVGMFNSHGETQRQLRATTELMRMYHENEISTVAACRFFELVHSTVTPDTLIILEEPYWWTFPKNERIPPPQRRLIPHTAEEFFERVCDMTKNVLAMGSRGPSIFTDTPLSCYPTWELNPNMTRQMLEPEFVFDHDAATRDFGG